MRRFLLLSMLAWSAWGGTIFDNGSPDQFDGSEMTGFLQAEDFTLSISATIDSVLFWTLEDAVSFSGSILWRIYSDNAGAPDSILFSGTDVPSRATTSLTGLSLDELVYGIATGGVTLSPGTYWLALHNGPISNSTGAQMFWESTGANTSANFGQEFDLSGVAWNSNGLEHAFQLLSSDVPEPSTMLLGLSALTAIFAARRYRG